MKDTIISGCDTSRTVCLEPIEIHNEVLKLCENNSLIRRPWNAGVFCQVRRRNNTESYRTQQREA